MPTNEFMADMLADYGAARLGGGAEFDGTDNPQEIRLFDVMLDPDISTVWSLVYLPPLGVQAPAATAPPTKLVPLSHDVAGKLLIGAGGAANAEIEFDWSAGGVVTVPASNVQLNAVYDPFFPAAMRVAPVGRFAAWIVPGDAGGARGLNYCTRRVFQPPILPASAFVAIPLGAKRVQFYAINLTAGALGIEVAVVDGGGNPLADFTIIIPPTGGTAAQSQIEALPYWLPRGASALAIGAGGILGNINLVTAVFELGF